MAITVPPLTTVVMNSVEERYIGVASGVNNAVSRAAGLLAVAVLGVVALTVFNQELDQDLATLDVSAAILAQLDGERNKLAEAEVPPEADETLAAALELAIDESFVASYRWIAIICAVLSIVGAIVGLVMMDNEKLDAHGGGHQSEGFL